MNIFHYQKHKSNRMLCVGNVLVFIITFLLFGIDAFMAVMEQDAQERGERRQKARKEAEIIKEEGNKYFKDGEYTRAVQLYTQVINCLHQRSGEGV